jgi:hypothetical protein
VEQGLAYPDSEPFGSFATAYRRAERGLEFAASQTEAHRVRLLLEAMTGYAEWRDHRGPEPLEPEAPRKPRPPDENLPEEELFEAHILYDLQLEDWKRQTAELSDARARWAKLHAAWSTPPVVPPLQEFEWLGRLKERRWPQDHGASKHRQPEPDHDAANYLDAHAMDREQLAALLSDPPEVVRQALVDVAPKVYAVLLAGGFDPEAPIKEPEELD